MYCVPVDFLSALNCAATFGSFVVDNIDREKIRQSRHRTPNGLLVLSNQASFSKIESDMINLFADACKERANYGITRLLSGRTSYGRMFFLI